MKYYGPILEYGPLLPYPRRKYHVRAIKVNNQYSISKTGLDAIGAESIEDGIQVFLDHAKYVQGHPDFLRPNPPEFLETH